MDPAGIARPPPVRACARHRHAVRPKGRARRHRSVVHALTVRLPVPVVEVLDVRERVPHHRRPPRCDHIAGGFQPHYAAVQRRYHHRSAPPLRHAELRCVHDARLHRVARTGQQLLELQPLRRPQHLWHVLHQQRLRQQPQRCVDHCAHHVDALVAWCMRPRRRPRLARGAGEDDIHRARRAHCCHDRVHVRQVDQLRRQPVRALVRASCRRASFDRQDDLHRARHRRAHREPASARRHLDAPDRPRRVDRALALAVAGPAARHEHWMSCLARCHRGVVIPLRRPASQQVGQHRVAAHLVAVVDGGPAEVVCVDVPQPPLEICHRAVAQGDRPWHVRGVAQEVPYPPHEAARVGEDEGVPRHLPRQRPQLVARRRP